MVKLTRIYTRGGDAGQTSLGDGSRVDKDSIRVEAYGTVDEANAAVGIVRLALQSGANPDFREADDMLGRVQNDLFDLGGDLCVPEAEDLGYEPLRITEDQVERLEREIDTMNAGLKPLDSFILPGGNPPATHLHLARTVARRAERLIVTLARSEAVNAQAVIYANRLSDHLFVMARWLNDRGRGDVLWVPGANR